MTNKELNELPFDDAIEKLEQEKDQITTYDCLKDFAIKNINEDMLFLAIHILQALDNDAADYYDYDYCMGTLDTPTPIKTKEDLEDYLD